MANDLNQCNFIGRLGNDVDIRYLPDGSAVANISIACGWKSKDSEGVEWIRIVAFKKLAEIMGQYLSKGSKVYVSGRMRTRKWTDQSGADRYSTEVVADRMQMLDSKPAENAAPQSSAQHSGGGYADKAAAYQRPAHTASNEPPPRDHFDQFDDDIPF